MIDKEDLEELMRDQKQERAEQDRRDEVEAREETRSDEEQGYHDSGMRQADFM